MSGSTPTLDATARRQAILTRLLAADTAKTSLLDYTRLTMPDSTDPSPNPRTRYLTGRHHELIARKLEELAAGNIKRLIINCGPRHGKSELASKRFISWFSGKYPELALIFGTYNDNFAGDNGRAVRGIIRSPEHQLVFPDHQIKSDNAAAQRFETTQGGQLSFVGRGGAITGRGGHGIVIDDPIKNRVEADSAVLREALWDWFTQVIATRLMTSESWIMLIQTRWHEDDLVGRLTDPLNPHYDAQEAAQWTVIDLPALALDNDVLGRKPGAALWPERFGRPFLEAQRRLDPRGFQALYQGQPAPADGNFFEAASLIEYDTQDLPANLRIYIASDHAVSTRQDRDKTAMIPVGVDEDDNIWVLPDVFWEAADSNRVVEAMLRMMQLRKPVYWWAERGHITKAIGPFLRKRMIEESTYCSILELVPVTDKLSRAQSIQARCAMGKVRFPRQAAWWPLAKDQLLKFPHGANDDFVDALAWIGLGLQSQSSANGGPVAKAKFARGTLGWVKEQTRQQERAARRQSEDF